MLKKHMLAISVSIVFSLSGCGGSDGGGTETQNTTGTGYYVDSAVSGVDYFCGSNEGTTDASGKFTFDVGTNCTFFIGDIKLRDVDKSILKNGVTVYETDPDTAQILQSLDSDGVPDNGITISENLVAALATEGITTLPTNEEEKSTMLSVIEDAGGAVVNETVALSHAMTTLLSDRTLYLVDPEGYNNQDLDQVFFDSEGFIKEDGDEVDDEWLFDGDTLIVGDSSHPIVKITDDYILFEDTDDGGNTRGYFEQSEADTFRSTLEENSILDGEYTLYGGNTYFLGGLSSMPEEFIKLGIGTGITTFDGTYKYYTIVNEGSDTAVYIDAAEGSNGKFYSTNTTSNTRTDSGDTWMNLVGSPDGVFVSIGPRGYALIDASSVSITSLTVYGQ